MCTNMSVPMVSLAAVVASRMSASASSILSTGHTKPPSLVWPVPGYFSSRSAPKARCTERTCCTADRIGISRAGKIDTSLNFNLEPWLCFPACSAATMGTGIRYSAGGSASRSLANTHETCSHNGTRRVAAPAHRMASEVAEMVLLPRASLSSASLRAASTSSCSTADNPSINGDKTSVTLRTAFNTPKPPKRSMSPSRRSSFTSSPSVTPSAAVAQPTHLEAPFQ
mmetsp:Transcript_18656/g.40465  ORF Transcript_18656/g.40465 Transcript_18656/m.40465 type:complete len:226 (+) Transcript_18656:674-1351(+)